MSVTKEWEYQEHLFWANPLPLIQDYFDGLTSIQQELATEPVINKANDLLQNKADTNFVSELINATKNDVSLDLVFPTEKCYCTETNLDIDKNQADIDNLKALIQRNNGNEKPSSTTQQLQFAATSDQYSFSPKREKCHAALPVSPNEISIEPFKLRTEESEQTSQEIQFSAKNEDKTLISAHLIERNSSCIDSSFLSSKDFLKNGDCDDTSATGKSDVIGDNQNQNNNRTGLDLLSKEFCEGKIIRSKDFEEDNNTLLTNVKNNSIFAIESNEKEEASSYSCKRRKFAISRYVVLSSLK